MELGEPAAEWLVSPTPLRGVRWFAPSTSPFGAVRSPEVGSRAVSAGGNAAGRGVGAVDRVPDPTPRPPALPTPRPLGRWAAYRAPLSLASFSLAPSPAAGRALETPRGLRLGKRAVRARLRPPRHVLGRRHQRPLPFAPPSLEQRLPAAGEGAAGPGEGRGVGPPPVREGGGNPRCLNPPECLSSPLRSGIRRPLQFFSHGAVIITGHGLSFCCVPGPVPRALLY